MSKVTPERLRDFSDHLKKLVEEKTPLVEAQVALQNKFSPDLNDILLEYSGEEHLTPTELSEWFAKHYETRLKNEAGAAWIKLSQLQIKSFIKKQQFKDFQDVIIALPEEKLLQIFSTDLKLLDLLLIPKGKEFLDFLVPLAPQILQIPYQGTPVLRFLCENRINYNDSLRTFKALNLPDETLLEINTAIDSPLTIDELTENFEIELEYMLSSSKSMTLSKAQRSLSAFIDPQGKVLEQYSNTGWISYSSLLLEARKECMDLMLYFLKINSAILTMVIKKTSGLLKRETPLTYFTEYAEEYPRVYKWIKTNYPDLAEKAWDDFSQTKNLQCQAATLITNGEIKKFEEFISLLTPEARFNLISLHNHSSLLEYLVQPEFYNYLFILINADVRTLRVDMYNKSVLNKICENENPVPFLQLILNKFRNELTADELQLLSEFPLEQNDAPSVAVPKTVFPRNQPLLELSQLESIFEKPQPKAYKKLLPYINTTNFLNSCALDAFLHQAFHARLQSQKIVLLPTLPSAKSISIDQLVNIQSGQPFRQTTNIEINGHIMPLQTAIKYEHVDYFILPINMVWHYGLLIIDCTHLKPRAIYVDPFSLETMLSITPRRKKALDLTQQQIQAQDFMHKNCLAKLTQNLNIDPSDFTYFWLGQSLTDDTDGSDYLVAVLGLLASRQIKLSENLYGLATLQGQSLSKTLITRIRMLQTQQFGLDYFQSQLSSEFHTSEINKLILRVQEETEKEMEDEMERLYQIAEANNSGSKRSRVSLISIFTPNPSAPIDLFARDQSLSP